MEEAEKKNLINRLHRVAGQINGITAMVEKDAPCQSTLNQVAAVNAALNSLSKELLLVHMKTCLVPQIENGDKKALEDFADLVKRLMH